MLTDRHETGPRSRFRGVTVFKTFAAIVVVTFLLRIFYAGHLYQDDGLWFTVGEEVLRGKVLYRDIYFDKPPAIALLYGALFKLFGAHLLTIRLFTIVYSIAVSAMLYIFGKRFYSERIGLLAATMFAVFSTIFTTGHVQGLNTDLLMTLPYGAGTYWLLRARGDLFDGRITDRQGARLALAGGAMIGIATQVNPKGVFGLAFFALFLLLAHRWQRKDDAAARRRGALFSLAGFVIGMLPFVIYISITHALGAYWRYVWEWGARYASYYPASYVAVMALGQTAQYFLLNSTLLIAVLFVAVQTCKRARRGGIDGAETAAEADFKADAMFRADAALLLWLAVSFVAMSVGGRFFGHYFFQVLPALCLIGARGITDILDARTGKEQGSRLRYGLTSDQPRPQRIIWRTVLLALLVIGFVVTVVRFHTRTVQLAGDWLRGAPSVGRRTWYHERLNDEERRVAAKVLNLSLEPADTTDRRGLESMRRGGPRERAPQGPSDYLFVWGYRPEIYYWSGLLPASKYLSTQPLTGVPADVHYLKSDYHSVLDERDTAAARQELARELANVQPEYIIDELGFFNGELAMARYSEFSELLVGYKNIGTVERFIVYRRWDIIKAYKREKQAESSGAEERSVEEEQK
jgi:4-amino-4-deoxy-L-arabinose transferase-like glycosyltransferase